MKKGLRPFSAILTQAANGCHVCLYGEAVFLHHVFKKHFAGIVLQVKDFAAVPASCVQMIMAVNMLGNKLIENRIGFLSFCLEKHAFRSHLLKVSVYCSGIYINILLFCVIHYLLCAESRFLMLLGIVFN